MVSTNIAPTQSYLHFLVGKGIKAVISMEKVLEVISIPVERITAIPNMPIYVLGLLHQRSRVLWLIDLPEFLGLPPINLNIQEYNIAIVEIQQKLAGLVVLEIQEVTRYPAESIEPQEKDFLIPQLQPYSQGNLRKSEKELLPILDVESIVNQLSQ